MLKLTTTTDAPFLAAQARRAQDALHPPSLDQDTYGPGLVARWDELIDWRLRQESEGDFFVRLLRSVGARDVLDVATGTGFHSIALGEAGFKVTSLDANAEMLRRATENAARLGGTLHPVLGDWRCLERSLTQTYDAVICLGSSFPHLFEREDREQALAGFYQALRPGGVLIVDHRNFDAVRAGRYANARRHYYCGTGVDISLAQMSDALCRIRYRFQDGASYHLDFYPLPQAEMRALLAEAGFVLEATFGDFQPDADHGTADFLIHAARKPLSPVAPR